MRFNLLRIFLIISIIFLCGCAEATIYHVASDGSGDFITVAQVNAFTFAIGDEVDFRGGDTWAEQLNCQSNVTYQSYGTGKGKIQNILIDTRVSKPKTNINIRNLTINANSLVTYGIYCANDETATGNNITIDSCDIYDNRYGIQFFVWPRTVGVIRFNNITVTNNNVYSNSEYGMAFTLVDNLYCAGNNVYDNGDSTVLSVNGIWLADNTTGIIEENTIYNNSTGNNDGCGIILDSVIWNGSSSCIVRKNKIYGHIHQITKNLWGALNYLGDGNSASIAIMSASYGNEIYDNLIYGNAFGIEVITSGSLDNKIYNNTITGNMIGIYSGDSAGVNYLRNNIVYNNKLNTGGYTANVGICIHSGAFDSDYNCVYDNTDDYYGLTDGVHSFVSDPLLTSNYHLNSTSPCKDTGINLSGVTDDYEGNPRPMGVGYDMGAYEYFKCKVRNAKLRNSQL